MTVLNYVRTLKLRSPPFSRTPMISKSRSASKTNRPLDVISKLDKSCGVFIPLFTPLYRCRLGDYRRNHCGILTSWYLQGVKTGFEHFWGRIHASTDDLNRFSFLRYLSGQWVYSKETLPQNCLFHANSNKNVTFQPQGIRS
jgi:hypothetical protein